MKYTTSKSGEKNNELEWIRIQHQDEDLRTGNCYDNSIISLALQT